MFKLFLIMFIIWLVGFCFYCLCMIIKYVVEFISDIYWMGMKESLFARFASQEVQDKRWMIENPNKCVNCRGRGKWTESIRDEPYLVTLNDGSWMWELGDYIDKEVVCEVCAGTG